jgi:PD-(D/E)XK nuclease superfamily protein
VLSEDGKVQKSSRTVSLQLGASFTAAWENVLLPWFQSVVHVSWQQQEPTLVVVPSRSHAYAIKGLLFDRGVSVLGIRFVTPPELRELLSSTSEMRLPLREHLRLLLSIAAEECMELPEDPALREKRMLEADFLAAKSVARSPDHLLRTIDQLGAAGWDFGAVELPALRDVEARFQRRLADCGFELIHTADRRALGQIGASPPLLTNILVTGFNGAHWPLWPLLRAGVIAANEATVLLDDPRDEARELDETWVGTWEEAFGEAKLISPSVNQISDSLFTETEMQGASVRPANCSFVVGADTTEQAEAIASMCVRFLSEEKCTRIGVVFAGTGSLPRLVAGALSKFAIPHNDGFGHPVPGLFESAEWRAWLQLQRGPRVNPLLRFLGALRNRDELFPELTIQGFERTLRSAHSEVLVDDLAVLQKFCAADAGERNQQVAKALQLIEFLPARGTFSEFLQTTENAFARLDWKQHWMEVASRSSDWAGKVEANFSRTLYLRWLEEIASSFGVDRAAAGDHPYARVHLLTVAEAQGQQWSHLIFAGWNEGSWPPRETGEFTRQDEINAFNRSIQKLNRHAARQGRQGEGHTAIHKNHTLYLGPLEQRQIALRQFEILFEAATEKTAFTANLVHEDAPQRLWNPSELFTRYYQEAHKSPLTQEAMGQLQALTRSWLDEARDPTRSDTPALQKTEPTRVAYDARRNPNVRSGEYDFAFRSKPSVVPTLSVSEFEQLIARAPALVWLKKYLGVKAPDESGNVWNISSGKWVHDWLAAIAAGTAKTFTGLPDSTEIERRICAAAEAKRSDVARLCQAAGKPVPDWWSGGWSNAVFLSRALADKLATVTDWPWMATEWTIDGDLAVKVTESAALFLRGRIDLLLARTEPAAGSLAAKDLWIIDYKTGAKKALAATRQDADGRRPALRKKLLDGSALQLGLYALAAGALGAQRTEVSLLSPFVRPLEPQISGADFSSEADIFAELAEMQQTGVFGMHGPFRSAYRFTDRYPLATLAIDPDILEQRWELTHPALVRDEEDMFW